MLTPKAGQRERAVALLAPYEARYPDLSIPVQWFALTYAFMGDEANSVKWLERSADRHEWVALNLRVHPAYAFMRNSPRFQALEKRIGVLRE